jgi:hypothetical protein
MSEVQIHEMGHSVGQLADEYDYPYTTTYSGSEPSQANITKSADRAEVVACGRAPTASAPSRAPGYYLYGLYRPKANCLMRSLGVAMCRVCQEGVVKITNSVIDTNVIDQRGTGERRRSTSSVPNLQPLLDHALRAGRQQPADHLEASTVKVIARRHQCSGYVLDPATDEPRQRTRCRMHREGPDGCWCATTRRNVMTESHSWQVVVADPTAAQLRFTVGVRRQHASTCNPGRNALASTPTVVNDGPGAAGPFDGRVLPVVSTSSTWNVQTSTWLGKTTVNDARRHVSRRTVQRVGAAAVEPAGRNCMYLFAVADRSNVVHESNENDNTRQQRRCSAQRRSDADVHLEFHDTRSTLGDAGNDRRSAPVAALHPTVVAPCANPATTLYLIAWTGSGTSPGVALAPGVTLPLNPDGLTTLGLDGLNGPVFGGFLGLLDAQGIGRATFTLPPGAGVPLGQTHFAGVLLGSVQLFTATTNPVSLQLGQ